VISHLAKLATFIFNQNLIYYSCFSRNSIILLPALCEEQVKWLINTWIYKILNCIKLVCKKVVAI
jgi:hypothetical protein